MLFVPENMHNLARTAAAALNAMNTILLTIRRAIFFFLVVSMVDDEARDREDAAELLGVGLIGITEMQNGEEMRDWAKVYLFAAVIS